jgi:hypothetical protein
MGGREDLRGCLQQIVTQRGGDSIEIVVPCDETVRNVDELRTSFPQVKFLDLGVVPTAAPPASAMARHERFEKCISAVLERASGSHVALLQDWSKPDRNWSSCLTDATRLPYAAVGGAIDHAGRGLLNWAVYFVDFGRYQPPLPGGPAPYASDMNIVYRLDDLEEVRQAWERQYNEALVNWSLRAKGKMLWLKPEMIVLHDRGRLSIRALIAERLSWGRVFGAARARALPAHRLLFYIVLSPLIPFVIVARAAAIVFQRGRNRVRFLQAFPLCLLLAVLWALGELAGYVTGRPAPERR